MLIHTLSDEAFIEKRIPGSEHTCGYEIALEEKISDLIPGKVLAIVLYGLNNNFGAAGLVS